MDHLLILGSCGGSRETYWIARENWPGAVILFVDDVSELRELSLAETVVPVVKDWDFSRFAALPSRPITFRYFVPGMGDPRVKKVATEKALSRGLEPAPPLISRQAIVRPDSRVGPGSVIHPTSLVTSNVTVGAFVTIHSARVGHDAVLRDYVTCNPGCNVAGHVVLAEGVNLGAWTVVRQRLAVAPWTVTGMQACVVKEVLQPNQTLVGVPARPMRDGTGKT